MAVVARKDDASINSITDLKGKKVGILTGTTQQVFFLERLHMVGMTEQDIVSVRIAFADMPGALQRGDIDAYVGAEPGPSLSLVSGVGKIVEYPYSTPMGSLNMILATHQDRFKEKPDEVLMMLDMQRQASAYAMSHPDEIVAMTVAKLGLDKAAVARAIDNVELNWEMTPKMVDEVKAYADHMLALRQIRNLPNFTALLDMTPSDRKAGMSMGGCVSLSLRGALGAPRQSRATKASHHRGQGGPRLLPPDQVRGRNDVERRPEARRDRPRRSCSGRRRGWSSSCRPCCSRSGGWRPTMIRTD